ncbi:hypothetical protein C8Q70DRAFT_972178 [Cubamyces menziesii]|nr:hypothetical protein C8Q70DRAFT_972178 [Cubamyces menziesii]
MPSEETKERIIKAVDLARVVAHYAWIPFIIYVGYTRSNPQPSLIKYVVCPRSLVLLLTPPLSRLISPLA